MVAGIGMVYICCFGGENVCFPVDSEVYFIVVCWLGLSCYYFVEGRELMYMRLCLCVNKEVIIGIICLVQVNREVGVDLWHVVGEQCFVMLF